MSLGAAFDAARQHEVIEASRAQQGAIRARSFGSVDTDGDRCVSADELAIGIAQYQSTYGGNAMLASLDTDGDGCLTEEEWIVWTGSLTRVTFAGNDW